MAIFIDVPSLRNAPLEKQLQYVKKIQNAAKKPTELVFCFTYGEEPSAEALKIEQERIAALIYAMQSGGTVQFVFRATQGFQTHKEDALASLQDCYQFPEENKPFEAKNAFQSIIKNYEGKLNVQYGSIGLVDFNTEFDPNWKINIENQKVFKNPDCSKKEASETIKKDKKIRRGCVAAALLGLGIIAASAVCFACLSLPPAALAGLYIGGMFIGAILLSISLNVLEAQNSNYLKRPLETHYRGHTLTEGRATIAKLMLMRMDTADKLAAVLQNSDKSILANPELQEAYVRGHQNVLSDEPKSVCTLFKTKAEQERGSMAEDLGTADRVLNRQSIAPIPV